MFTLLMITAIAATKPDATTEPAAPIILVQARAHRQPAGPVARMFGIGPNTWSRLFGDPRLSPWIYGQNPYANPYYQYTPPAYPYYPYAAPYAAPAYPQYMPPPAWAYPQYLPPTYPQAPAAPAYPQQQQALPTLPPGYQLQQ